MDPVRVQLWIPISVTLGAVDYRKKDPLVSLECFNTV